MFRFLKSRKALIIAALVTILGWAGVQVNERDLTNIANVVLEDGQPVEQQQTQQAPAQAPQQESTTPQSQAQPEPANNNAKSNAGGISGDFNKASSISPQRREHILHGDATGGGHMHGANKPCKSEFPEHWDEDTIIKEVELIAANDNLAWQQQRNGYYVAEQKVGTVKVRVVKGRNGKDVITAYPTNVKRNPCPRQGFPANDN